MQELPENSIITFPLTDEVGNNFLRRIPHSQLRSIADDNFVFNTELIGSDVGIATEAALNFNRVFSVGFIINPN